MIFKSKRFYHYPVPTPCLGFIAVKDNFTVIKGGSEILNVLLNDTYIGTPIVTITIPPTNGTAVVNLDNTITYTHDGTDNLTDSFEYQLSNGICSDTATVGISVGEEVDCFKLVQADYFKTDQNIPALGLNFEGCDGTPYGFNISGVTPINICANINSINTGLPPDIGFLPSEGNITGSEIESAILNNGGLVERIIITISTASIIGELKLTFSNCDLQPFRYRTLKK
jgi:hypothetical protein